MGTNVGISLKSNKRTELQDDFDKELSQCMKCKFFWGNDSRCIHTNCYKEKKQETKDKKSICEDCPYKQSSGYCFPCMRDLMMLDK